MEVKDGMNVALSQKLTTFEAVSKFQGSMISSSEDLQDLALANHLESLTTPLKQQTDINIK